MQADDGPPEKADDTLRYECIGGPLDGWVISLPPGRTEYAYRGGVYRLQGWVKRDTRGGVLWERECLVWAPMR